VLLVLLKKSVRQRIYGGAVLCCVAALTFLLGAIANAQAVRIVDSSAIRADGDPARAVMALTIPGSMQEKF